MYMCTYIRIIRVKELTPGGRRGPRGAGKPKQVNSDFPPEDDEGRSSAEEEVPSQNGLSPANSDLQMLHRHLKKV